MAAVERSHKHYSVLWRICHGPEHGLALSRRRQPQRKTPAVSGGRLREVEG